MKYCYPLELSVQTDAARRRKGASSKLILPGRLTDRIEIERRSTCRLINLDVYFASHSNYIVFMNTRIEWLVVFNKFVIKLKDLLKRHHCARFEFSKCPIFSFAVNWPQEPIMLFRKVCSGFLLLQTLYWKVQTWFYISFKWALILLYYINMYLNLLKLKLRCRINSPDSHLKSKYVKRS